MVTQKKIEQTEYLSYTIKFLFIFIAYISTGIIGLHLDAVNGFATLVWAPTGISLAALILFGYRFWPAIATGAYIVNFVSGAPVLGALGISLGNTMEAVVGAELLKRAGFDPSLQRVNDVLKLIILGAVLSTLVSATFGVISLLFTGKIALSAITNTWTAWWVGDMLGNLIIAPLLLTWLTGKHLLIKLEQRFEFTLWVFSVLAFGVLVFGQITQFSPLSFLVFPPLIWGALRFRLPFISAATFGLSLLAIWGTTQGLGPFVQGSLSESLLFLQVFIGVLAIATMLLSVSTLEVRDSEGKARELNERLEDKIKVVERLNKIMVGYIKKDRVEKIKSNTLKTTQER